MHIIHPSEKKKGFQGENMIDLCGITEVLLLSTRINMERLSNLFL